MVLFLSPIVIAIGVVLFEDRQYLVISMGLAVMACLAFYLSFESKQVSTRRLVIIAVMVALCVIGRGIFVVTPGFKPVTALVILTAMYFGSEAGFLTGSMAALTSNMLFGQGPWTPFQMIAWGGIGFVAGLPMMQKLLQSKIWLVMYGIVSGILFSLIMDIWSVIAMDGTFHIARFQVKVLTSLPFMVIYAVSNVFFLLITRQSIGSKLKRICIKYGL